MSEDGNAVGGLTGREKEALRLLLAGHDAKSSARELDLSVHTVNDHLRSARRKLDVSSSREAARMLAEAEGGTPNSFGTQAFWDGSSAPGQQNTAAQRGTWLAWLTGGMLVMSLIIAAAVLTTTLQGGGAAQAPSTATAPQAVEETAASAAAREWLALIDEDRWDQSWQTTADIFRSQVTTRQWVQSMESVREPLGPVSARVLVNVIETNDPPGAPPGDYRMLQFQTDFAQKPGSVETVVLSREDGAWKVSGYFIR